MLAIERPVSTIPIIEPILQVNEIQGSSLGGFQKDHEMLMFLKITDVAIAADSRWAEKAVPTQRQRRSWSTVPGIPNLHYSPI